MSNPVLPNHSDDQLFGADFFGNPSPFSSSALVGLQPDGPSTKPYVVSSGDDSSRSRPASPTTAVRGVEPVSKRPRLHWLTVSPIPSSPSLSFNDFLGRESAFDRDHAFSRRCAPVEAPDRDIAIIADLVQLSEQLPASESPRSLLEVQWPLPYAFMLVCHDPRSFTRLTRAPLGSGRRRPSDPLIYRGDAYLAHESLSESLPARLLQRPVHVPELEDALYVEIGWYHGTLESLETYDRDAGMPYFPMDRRRMRALLTSSGDYQVPNLTVALPEPLDLPRGGHAYIRDGTWL